MSVNSILLHTSCIKDGYLFKKKIKSVPFFPEHLPSLHICQLSLQLDVAKCLSSSQSNVHGRNKHYFQVWIIKIFHTIFFLSGSTIVIQVIAMTLEVIGWRQWIFKNDTFYVLKVRIFVIKEAKKEMHTTCMPLDFLTLLGKLLVLLNNLLPDYQNYPKG